MSIKAPSVLPLADDDEAVTWTPVLTYYDFANSQWTIFWTGQTLTETSQPPDQSGDFGGLDGFAQELDDFSFSSGQNPQGTGVSGSGSYVTWFDYVTWNGAAAYVWADPDVAENYDNGTNINQPYCQIP